jgi:hypothetical protein
VAALVVAGERSLICICAPRENYCAVTVPLLESALFGAWRSLVARFNGVEEVVGSNPAAPTGAERRVKNAAFCVS